MFHALYKIELLSVSLSFGAMIAVGIVLIAAGLCVWLGGMRWHFLSAVLSGAFAGLVCVCFTPEQFQMKAFCIAAVAGALLVMVFRKRSLVFVAALIVVFSGLFISALPGMNASSDWDMPSLPELAEGVEKFAAADTFSSLADVLFFMCGMVGKHIIELSAGSIIISSAAGLAVLSSGIFFARIVSGVGSSMLGTFFVFAGMIVLLLQKGSMPFSGIYQKPIFFQTIIICMIIFGSMSGLLLCPKRRCKSDHEKMKTEKKNELI
ncbi:MAG: hypothetical protein FVQ82_01390 [Planctomycetes bacterium]|nr:hypothetical protein [Planctomycetota bacterium]